MNADPTLTDIEWIVAEHLDANGAMAPIAGGIRASLRFSGGRLSGSGGCNRLTGTYTARDDGSLSIGQVATTRMACAPETDAVERSVLAALDVAAGYRIGDGSLHLTDAANDTILRLEPSPLTVVGTDWTAIMINNGRGAVVSLAAGTQVDLRFGEDGQLAGSGGCNRVFGPYQLDGETIRIGPVASSGKLCFQPEGVMEQEQAFLVALERSASVELADGRLQLRDADGALQVDLRPRDGV